MSESSILPQWMIDLLQERLGDRVSEYLIPPPISKTLETEFLQYNPDRGTLKIRLPIIRAWLNPYGAMQGGMVAAAVDAALGPLSMLVAPPNVTRRLRIKYSSPATLDLEHLLVTAYFLERRKRWLEFSAEVRSPQGQLIARAQATHWIID